MTVGDDNTVRLWDIRSGEPELLLSYIFFTNDNYVIMNKEYRFDTPDLDSLDGVYWLVDRFPGAPIALASLMRVYYQPRLAEYVLNGKKLAPLPTIEQLNLAQHGVKLVGVKPEPDAPDQVAVTVEVYVRGDDPNHPAQELKLFRDGQLVGKYTGENNGLFDLPDGKLEVTFHNIALPQNKSQVMFKGWAFNEDGVRSKYFDRPYDYKPVAKAAPKLHLVSVGVNSFDNPAWDLKLASNDAKGYAEILPAKLGVPSDVQLLASGDGLTKPSKENLKAALQKLAEDGSSPDDVVVLAIASHGLTDDQDNQFYIIPADIPGQDKKITPELLAHSISTDELSDWLNEVDAAEIVMILDTCQSGAALGGETFKPGPMGDKGLGQLAYDKAMLVLTATNENNAAMELDNLGHGLLSFALLIDGLETGLAGKGEFTFKDWLAYGQKHTAELYAKIAKGESVGETRGKVKVDKSADNANPPLGQEPYLFDFGGDDKETIRFKVK
ncbi:caspase family protein [Deltaproteobacteria bacterium OttesenSCG-928-M10]|nr:caspase family protein [Deltaproteobacteria bacterium OttesenSCG-928-M10]